jgi:hypothetical protein
MVQACAEEAQNTSNSSRVGLQRAQEDPQREDVVIEREGAHGHDELYLGVLGLVDAHRFDLCCECVW